MAPRTAQFQLERMEPVGANVPKGMGSLAGVNVPKGMSSSAGENGVGWS